MKKALTPFLFSFLLFLFMAFSQIGLAQVPPPQPPSNKGAGGNQGPTGAPIDGGVGIALAMVAGYGAYKWLSASRKKKQVIENQ
jgi:hypothetical protein